MQRFHPALADLNFVSCSGRTADSCRVHQPHGAHWRVVCCDQPRLFICSSLCIHLRSNRASLTHCSCLSRPRLARFVILFSQTVLIHFCSLILVFLFSRGVRTVHSDFWRQKQPLGEQLRRSQRSVVSLAVLLTFARVPTNTRFCFSTTCWTTSILLVDRFALGHLLAFSFE